MVVTPFGELALGDRISIERFIDAHARRHNVYTQLTGIAGGSLQGLIDGDWMLRHWARHVSLASVTSIDLSSADSKALALPGFWLTQQQLIDWTEAHNRHHLKIDQQLKVSG